MYRIVGSNLTGAEEYHQRFIMVIKFHSSQRAMPIWVPTLCAEAAHMIEVIHMSRKLVVVVVVVVVQGATQLANEAPMRPSQAW
jgi:hypothetical protein